jgi:hypothetical protein
MTIIEIRPYRNGWQVYEAPGVEPVFPEKSHATLFKSRARLDLISFVVRRGNAADSASPASDAGGLGA